MTQSEKWDQQYLSTLNDAKYYNHQLISRQLKALVGKNVQHYFSSLNKILVKWNGMWVEFEVYNKVFKIL